jgi:predicted regulator of Ras-like GTPase activity (Roadblock/LC7/MglB family)
MGGYQEATMTDQQSMLGPKTYRSGFSLSAERIAEIQRRLSDLLAAIPGRLVILVDITGQLVTSAGETQNVDADALGSLIAGDLAASQEIARMTGEFQDFQMVLREGQRSHIIISEAGDYLIFLVQFSKQVPLGWARKIIQNAAVEIGDILVKPSPEPQPPLADQFEQEGLTDLFSDALDDLWKG